MSDIFCECFGERWRLGSHCSLQQICVLDTGAHGMNPNPLLGSMLAYTLCGVGLHHEAIPASIMLHVRGCVRILALHFYHEQLGSSVLGTRSSDFGTPGLHRFCFVPRIQGMSRLVSHLVFPFGRE